MRVLYLVTSLVALAVLAMAYRNSRFGVTSPAYDIIQKDGAFEIRDYPEMNLVSTPLPRADVTEGSSFQRLFRYISGANDAEQKIAMTTPVITSRESGSRRLSFIVPPSVAAEGAPRPTSEDVELGILPGGRFAAYRFSGSWDSAKLEDAAEKLERWMRQRGLTAAESAMVANYDPPFMPSFLRRNEILVRLEPPSTIRRDGELSRNSRP